MIRGIGTDVVDIRRMSRFFSSGADKRCFTEAERAYIMAAPRAEETAAAIFAAKEALYKAAPEDGLSMKEREVCHGTDGRPFFRLPVSWRGGRVHLSLSHDGDYALAFVIVEEAQHE